MMGFAPSHDNKVNIHIGGQYGSKQRALTRFAQALDRLSPGCRARLTGGWVGGRAGGARVVRELMQLQAAGKGLGRRRFVSPRSSQPPPAAVENDDRPGYYAISDLLPFAATTGTPLVS